MKNDSAMERKEMQIGEQTLTESRPANNESTSEVLPEQNQPARNNLTQSKAGQNGHAAADKDFAGLKVNGRKKNQNRKW